ncbi:asparagine synthase-related protein [Halomarina salina]|uniref:Asparagine synthase-related protein n=1 Tax=Halomarina salina TaxID=1872699 RepID=A0ABD5RNL5_9EURY|nr:asparagine synthetase B family protein [Halomarina salina]
MPEYVHLAYPQEWVRGDDTAVRGTAFADGERFDAHALHDQFADVTSREEFRQVLTSLQGYYAVVHAVDGTVFAATDHAQSIPLFYAPESGVVSDSARWVRETLDDPTVDAVAEAEYLTATYVTGDETLYPSIRQLQAGELLALDTSGATPTVHTERHWTYSPTATADDPDATPSERLAAFDDAMVESFERTLAVADGRPVVVPLSGGYDSRLIASMLVRLDYEGDVYTFTYGQPGSPDVRVAEDIAASLGLPWRYVEYTADDWYEWFNGVEREAYYERADNFDAIPNLTGWPAIGELLADGWLPEDALVVPGQTVAGIGGHLPDPLLDAVTEDGAVAPEAIDPENDAATDAFVESVLDEHYVQWDRTDALDRAFAERIRKVVDGVCQPGDPTSAYAAWEWQERQSKFLCSDGRIYEHWGLDWWLPLWDPGVAAAWGAFPATARADKRRYTEYVETLYADVADVDDTEAERTHANDSRLTAGITRALSAVEDSPLADLARPLYRRYRTRTHSRSHGHLGHLGILPPEQFDRLYTAERTHHALRAVEALGRVAFDPPHERGWPGETLSVAALDRTRSANGPVATSPRSDSVAPDDGELVEPTSDD